MRIPITMCHGVQAPDCGWQRPLTAELLDRFMRIAADLGFQSIGYDDLEAWRVGTAGLPERPMMLDFDHPVRSQRYGAMGILARYGFRGNLFIQTEPMVATARTECLAWLGGEECMTWDEVRELMDAGWNIGAHTHTHADLSRLSLEDPDGEMLRHELDTNDALIREHLGVTPRDFAFTGTSFSAMAAKAVAERYRFGRLWTVGADYQVDGKTVRYADLAGVPGPNLQDGGPPDAARYITRATHAYRLPAMELTGLIYAPEAFRAYLEGALHP